MGSPRLQKATKVLLANYISLKLLKCNSSLSWAVITFKATFPETARLQHHDRGIRDMNLATKMRETFTQKVLLRHLRLGGVIAVCAVSIVAPQVDAQDAFATPNPETAFTPIALSGQTTDNLVLASLSPTSPLLQASSPLPRFDMTDAAQRYVTLVNEADRMANLPVLSTDAIAQALRVTAQTSNTGISEGAWAYATQVAASKGEFAAGLRTVVNILGREAVFARLKSDPDAFLALISGAREAVQAASGALAASETKLARAQEILGEAAYSVQTLSWSQSAVDTQATLAAHRQAAVSPLPRSEVAPPVLVFQASDAPINGRYLLAASYRILGDDVAASEILDRPLGRMCMNRVQLNVRQCLAASQYPYEHLFCLSKHSFGETLGCVKDTVK
jgi:hypothetical protein